MYSRVYDLALGLESFSQLTFRMHNLIITSTFGSTLVAQHCVMGSTFLRNVDGLKPSACGRFTTLPTYSENPITVANSVLIAWHC